MPLLPDQALPVINSNGDKFCTQFYDEEQNFILWMRDLIIFQNEDENYKK